MPRFGRKVPSVGRHRLASNRRIAPVVLAALVAPVAVLFAAGGDVHPLVVSQDAKPVVREAAASVDDVMQCCFEVVAASPVALSSASAPSGSGSGAMPLVSASRWRVDTRPLLLPVGDAPEQGLQVRTILVSRLISELFPEIHSIGGVRPDALRWHPDGLALDVMIPNPELGRGHRTGQRDRRVRAEERGSARNSGFDLARHLLHACRRAQRWIRAFRPRPHHHDRRRIPHRQRAVLPLSSAHHLGMRGL